MTAAVDHKDEFLDLISHELRTPLTVLLGGTRLLARQIDSLECDDRDALLADIIAAGERLERLIDNLMTLARQEGRPEELEPVLLQRLIPDLVEDFRAQADVDIAVQLPRGLPPVLGSPVSIHQVLVNLLSNARKYADGVARTEIGARLRPGYVVVSVRDHGFGIAPGDANRLFEPFFRSEQMPAGRQGAGLGLAVCKRLIEAQNGRIWSMSPGPGKGAVFNFALHVADDPSSRQRALRSAARARASRAG